MAARFPGFCFCFGILRQNDLMQRGDVGGKIGAIESHTRSATTMSDSITLPRDPESISRAQPAISGRYVRTGIRRAFTNA